MTCLFAVLLLLPVAALAVSIDLWTNFTVPNAAFVQVVQNDLFVTAFGVTIAGSISRVANIGSQLQSGGAIAYTTPVTKLVWPNEITPLPKNLSAFIVGDGFLPPGKTTGSLTLIGWNDPSKFVVEKLTVDKSGWWYHKGLFVDVNCDGAPDIVTARGTAGWFGGSGELVWIDGADNTMHHLATGPDVNFDINYQLNGTSAPFVVYASEFFGKQLTAFEITCGGVVSQRTVLDNQIGEVFSVQLVDLNNTGVKNQLVVTNYAYTPPGSLFLYDLTPGNPLSIAQRRTISNDFKNKQWSPGSGAPGQVLAIWPNVPPRAGDRAVLAVAGDGSEDLHFFAPDASSPSGYKLAQKLSLGVTVGGICTADVDGDGHSEVFVALYESSTILVFKIY